VPRRFWVVVLPPIQQAAVPVRSGLFLLMHRLDVPHKTVTMFVVAGLRARVLLC
jgi:hypothetical protein